MKWLGRCPSCEGWNTLVEEVAPQGAPAGRPRGATAVRSVPVTEAKALEEQRWTLGDAELDRVFGGGIVPGSLMLVGGEPGVGKSTLLLQVASLFAHQHGSVLYVSGEESVEQVAMRARRWRTSRRLAHLKRIPRRSDPRGHRRRSSPACGDRFDSDHARTLISRRAPEASPKCGLPATNWAASAKSGASPFFRRARQQARETCRAQGPRTRSRRRPQFRGGAAHGVPVAQSREKPVWLDARGGHL